MGYSEDLKEFSNSRMDTHTFGWTLVFLGLGGMLLFFSTPTVVPTVEPVSTQLSTEGHFTCFWEYRPDVLALPDLVCRPSTELDLREFQDMRTLRYGYWESHLTPPEVCSYNPSLEAPGKECRLHVYNCHRPLRPPGGTCNTMIQHGCRFDVFCT